MGSFIVHTPLRLGSKTVAPGKVVTLDEDEAGDLLALGAIAPAPKGAAADASGTKEPTLADLTVAKLLELAKAESIAVDDGAKKADLIAAIEKARADKAAADAAQSGGTE